MIRKFEIIKLISCGMVSLICSATIAQNNTDTSKPDSLSANYLPEITLVGKNSKSDYQPMPEVVGTNIYAGKKSAVIVLNNVNGNISSNTMRQILTKIPGIHIWESDPSGIQVGIAARGLSPNRSWEFNVRQNGYDIAADPFGYPEAYYNPQMQCVQRIEVVRGQGSLQYGPQFGGLVNYILKDGSDIKKPFQFETQQTLQTNNQFNSFNAIGGNTKKINYYTFYDYRSGSGYRTNSKYYTNNAFASITFKNTSKYFVTAEVMYAHIRSQQAGGLTDAQIKQNPKQSFRERNWFDITWLTPAVTLNYNINLTTKWVTKLFGTFGQRNSVGFLQPITVKDSINKLTNSFNTRNLNGDTYTNYGLESRIAKAYSLGKTSNTFSGGIRLYTGTTHRLTDGKGTTGSNYTMEITSPYQKDINFKSYNVAAFAENIFRLTHKLSVIPGIRAEFIEGTANGINGYDVNTSPIYLQNIKRKRSFVLMGIGAEYQLYHSIKAYSNFTQGYRPIQFANLQAPPSTDVIDPNLQDSKGYNFDFGFKGTYKNFVQFDVSLFLLQYNNRVGTVTPTGADYRLVTNVGSSTSKGFEGMAEIQLSELLQIKKINLSLYGSYSYTQAKYNNDFKITAIKNNWVENAPQNIFRGGITFENKFFKTALQVSAVSKAYSDANNTVTPTVNAQSGIIPGYTVADLTLTFKINNQFKIQSGVNNLFNTYYFTRRAGGYPGPGALPADGRTAFVTITANF